MLCHQKETNRKQARSGTDGRSATSIRAEHEITFTAIQQPTTLKTEGTVWEGSEMWDSHSSWVSASLLVTIGGQKKQIPWASGKITGYI